MFGSMVWQVCVQLPLMPVSRRCRHAPNPSLTQSMCPMTQVCQRQQPGQLQLVSWVHNRPRWARQESCSISVLQYVSDTCVNMPSAGGWMHVACSSLKHPR